MTVTRVTGSIHVALLEQPRHQHLVASLIHWLVEESEYFDTHLALKTPRTCLTLSVSDCEFVLYLDALAAIRSVLYSKPYSLAFIF